MIDSYGFNRIYKENKLATKR